VADPMNSAEGEPTMYLDRTEAEAKVSVQPSLKDEFIAWVGKQPADEIYNYTNACTCACAKFAEATGRGAEWQAAVGSSDPDSRVRLWRELDRYASAGSQYLCDHRRWSYGALYRRLTIG
jgi:hypothetical protein